MVISGREAGGNVSLEDVAIKSLVPAVLDDVSLDEFMTRFSDFDAEMDAQIKVRQDSSRGYPNPNPNPNPKSASTCTLYLSPRHNPHQPYPLPSQTNAPICSFSSLVM